MLRPELHNQFSHSLRLKIRHQHHGHTQNQRHMKSANKTICRKDWNYAKKTISPMVINTAIAEINSYGIHTVVGHHYAFRYARSATGIGYSHHGITHVRCFFRRNSFSFSEELIPRNYIFILWNIILRNDIFQQTQHRWQRSCR